VTSNQVGTRTLLRGNFALSAEQWCHEAGWNDRVLFHVADGEVTHGQLYDLAARTGSVLAQLGAGPGSHVLMVMADSVEFAAVFLGALRIGAVPVTVNPLLTPAEHAAYLEDVRPAVVVADAELAARFPATPLLVADDIVGQAAAAQPAAAASLPDGAPGYVQFTSGTTGRPKGAVHSQPDILTYYAAVADGVYRIGCDDVFLCVSKMFFAYGLPTSLFHPLLSGASAVLIRGRPTSATVARLCQRHGVTILLSVPTFFADLLDTAPASAFITMRIAVSGGEPLLRHLKERAEQLLGAAMVNHLGSTEVGHGFVGDLPGAYRAGAAGRALPPYRVEVRDEHGNPVPLGEQGIVWVSGPTLLARYLNQPKLTESVKVGDWFRSGDMGVLDADGYLRLGGRADDIEIVSGHKLWPGEIEAVLGRHPAVITVAVVGEIDERGASRLHALVVPRAGTDIGAHLAEELVAMARDGLAPFKVPRRFTFVDELPRTPTGKLQRFRLRQDLPAFVGDRPSFARSSATVVEVTT